MQTAILIVCAICVLAAIILWSRYSTVVNAKNNTELLLGKSQMEIRSMRSDIRYLVSSDPSDSAEARYIYNKWRDELGLTEKEEHKPVLAD